MKKLIYSLISLAIIVATVNFIAANYNNWQRKLQPINIDGTIITKPFNLPAFTLNSSNDKKFTDQDLIKNWSILYFGYSRCPHICPATLSTLSNMYETIKTFELDKHKMPQVIFISIDSEVDNYNPDNINKYAKYFNKNFIGLSGNDSQIQNITKAIGVAFKKLSDTPADGEIFDHSSTIFVINPKGQLQALFSAPYKADNLAKDYRSILNKYS